MKYMCGLAVDYDTHIVLFVELIKYAKPSTQFDS
jgi:hypothetical protein